MLPLVDDLRAVMGVGTKEERGEAQLGSGSRTQGHESFTVLMGTGHTALKTQQQLQSQSMCRNN